MATKVNGSNPITMTEQEQINILAYLHAEQRWQYLELVGRVTNIGTALAGILADKAQPQIQQQIQQEILNQLMDGHVLKGE